MKGIKCTSNEVNSILAGDKGQIRLVIKRQPSHPNAEFAQTIESTNKKDENTCRWVVRTDPYYIDESLSSKRFKWPHQIGDLVFVKESFFEDFEHNRIFYDENFCQDTKTVTYLVEGEQGGVCEARIEKLKPAHYMKQHQSRITLRIKDISVERLQEISEEDCWKEGFSGGYNDSDPCGGSTGYSEFTEFWNATHKKPEEKWEANPWIWKIEIEVVK